MNRSSPRRKMHAPSQSGCSRRRRRQGLSGTAGRFDMGRCPIGCERGIRARNDSRGRTCRNRRAPRSCLGAPLETARETFGGFLERSILGHDGDRRLAPVKSPVQTGAENIVLQTDLAWIQEGPTVGRTSVSRIEEARPTVVDIKELALPRPAVAERILVARTDCPTRKRPFVVRRSGGN